MAAVPIRQRRIAVLAYGSLIRQPGAGLALVIASVEPCRTPFPVEYGRASRRWHGGPVLVPHERGAPVDGALLLLADDVDLGTAVELLAAREGLESGRGVVEVDMPGNRLVIAAALPRNLPAPDMEPDALARRAVDSARHDARNGVAYLNGALRSGVRTPASEAYARSVMELVGATSLDEAERLLAFARSTATLEG